VNTEKVRTPINMNPEESADTIEALRAEVARLKLRNEGLEAKNKNLRRKISYLLEFAKDFVFPQMDSLTRIAHQKTQQPGLFEIFKKKIFS
jgi:cell division protein FtsB